MRPLEFAPERTQPASAIGNGEAKEGLDRLAVAHAVHERADAADSLGYMDVVGIVALLHQELEAAVDIAYLRHRAHHLLILEV